MLRHIRDFVRELGILHGLAVLVLLIASTTVLINRGGSILTLLAGSAATMSATDTVLYITPHGTSSLKLGETENVDIRVSTKTAINTIGATIAYPQDALEIVGISKEQSFLDLWTEETVINERDGEVHFSGGTVAKGGLSGMGTIVTLKVKAKKAGKAELAFKDAQVFAADGSGRPIESQRRTFVFEVPKSDEPVASAASRMNNETLPPPPIDFNGDGKVNVIDLSIMAFQVLGSYNVKFDLDRDGSTGLADISIFFTRMRD